MLKKLCLLLLCLLLPVLAGAEDVPTLQDAFVMTDLPKGLLFTVYSGPGEEYYIANAGRARVSTNDTVLCYGRVDDRWLMISYETSGGRNRIGYINLEEHGLNMPDCRRLSFGKQMLQVNYEFITDDPYGSGQIFGTLAGDITVLAWMPSGNWAYVEGHLTEYNKPTRGFVRKSSLSFTQLIPDMPQRANLLSHLSFDARHELNLPDDALAEGMAVYPLTDGSYLITYRCHGSDKLWMRVVSRTGRKLFAKSVPELYLSQITPTETGFICQTFDNPEADSGMRYTYTCKGRKWTSKKVNYIEEADRFYSDSTAHFAIRRYVFCEGSVFPITVTNLATGAEAQHRMTSYPHSYKPFVYEMDGRLLMCGGDETGAYTLRIFGDAAEEQYRIPLPEDMPDQNRITSAIHDDGAVYFYAATDNKLAWQRWRLDRTTMTFDPTPLEITVPTADCMLTAIAATVPHHLVRLDTGLASMLCDVTSQGTLMKVMTLNDRAVWSSRTETGCMLLLPGREGNFVFEYYDVK